jgi:hypothetical protein
MVGELLRNHVAFSLKSLSIMMHITQNERTTVPGNCGVTLPRQCMVVIDHWLLPLKNTN